nr:vegetative cell wall protein gp1-like [Aegilops tauschii subsp. strangulata]
MPPRPHLAPSSLLAPYRPHRPWRRHPSPEAVPGATGPRHHAGALSPSSSPSPAAITPRPPVRRHASPLPLSDAVCRARPRRCTGQAPLAAALPACAHTLASPASPRLVHHHRCCPGDAAPPRAAAWPSARAPGIPRLALPWPSAAARRPVLSAAPTPSARARSHPARCRAPPPARRSRAGTNCAASPGVSRPVHTAAPLRPPSPRPASPRPHQPRPPPLCSPACPFGRRRAWRSRPSGPHGLAR